MTTATNTGAVSTINAAATNGQSSEPTRELSADELAQVSGGIIGILVGMTTSTPSTHVSEIVVTKPLDVASPKL
jgi:bacteriocin-like protein